MNELTYIRVGDYYIPDLKLAKQPDKSIGKYGRMRQQYLKEHRPALYSSLLLTEKLLFTFLFEYFYTAPLISQYYSSVYVHFKFSLDKIRKANYYLTGLDK